MVLKLIQEKGTKGDGVLFLNKHTEGGRKGWGQGGKKEEGREVGRGESANILQEFSFVLISKKNPKQNRTETRETQVLIQCDENQAPTPSFPQHAYTKVPRRTQKKGFALSGWNLFAER